MLGQMMRMPLTISSLIRHADRWHGDTEVISRLPEGLLHPVKLMPGPAKNVRRETCFADRQPTDHIS